ncbi:MAG: hypothetical protein ABNH02_09355 [Pseudomonadales bacterium]
MKSRVVFSKSGQNSFVMALLLGAFIIFGAYALESWTIISFLTVCLAVVIAGRPDEVAVSIVNNKLIVSRKETIIGLVDDVESITSISVIEPSYLFSMPKISVVTEDDSYEWDLSPLHHFDSEKSNVSSLDKLVSI